MNEIFKHFISRDSKDDLKRAAYISWFCDQFPLREFSGVDYLFQEYTRFSTELEVPFKMQYLEVFITTELMRVMVSSKVRVQGTEMFSYDDPLSLETAFQITSGVLKSDFQALESMESDVDDFKVDIILFMRESLNTRYIEALSKQFERSQKSQDVFTAIDDSIEDLMILKEIYDPDAASEITNCEDDDGDMVPVVTSGLPALDKDMYALCTTQLLGIAAPTGYGKTRMAVGLWAYRCATVKPFNNVMYHVLEQNKSEIEAILVSVHAFALWGIVVSDKMILTKTIPDELKDKITAARIDLFESGKYGKIDIYEKDLYDDTFIPRLKVLDNLNGPYQLIIIDYMSLIETSEGNSKYKQDWQTTKGAYRKFKKYLRNKKKAGIAVDQLNKEGDAAARLDKDILPSHWQNGMEALKSCDFGLVLTGTPVMLSQRLRTLQQPKVRSSSGVPRLMLKTRLEISHFEQDITNKL